MGGKSRVFRDFLLSYLAILLIPITMLVVVYIRIPRIVRSVEVEGVQSALEKAAASIDRELVELEKLVLALSQGPQLRKLGTSREPFDGADYVLLWNVIEEFGRYSAMNLFAHSFYAYLGSSDRIITAGASY